MSSFSFARVKDPAFFAENRLPAHSDHLCLVDGEPLRQSLNGLWYFSYARTHSQTVADFEAVGYDCRNWDTIRVPAHIQLEGYDRPQYANVQYPWDGVEAIDSGEIPTYRNTVGSYVKYITLPEKWAGNPIYISFQGVESAMALWCNGSYVGYSTDSFTPHEFELTPYLQPGENKLAVQVYKWSAGSWCEDQDFFRFSGIYRDVFLYTVPKLHLQDIKVQTLLNDSFSAAVLSLDLLTCGEGSAAISLTTACGQVITTGCGRAVATAQTQVVPNMHLELTVDAPSLWSAEDPYLYDLTIVLTGPDGQTVETITQKVGFRRFEIKDSIMLLNGKRIVFNGVNRHEFSSKGGRTVTDEELLQDILTMKRNNINAIRTCHYPDDSRIYALCDQYGLYMIDECNLESHGSWDPVARGMKEMSLVVPGDRPEWHDAMLDRVNSLYQRDKNHPAVLIWSCGNESFGGLNIFEMSQLFRRLDSTRPVHYEGVRNDRRYNATSDIESQMYTHVDAIRDFLQKDRSKPFICCEYAHAMGNSCGAMHKYIELTETEPLYQGGFIWDYIDQSLTTRNRYGAEFEAYGGDFGDRPTDYNFSGNGIVYGVDRKPSPKMAEVKFCYQGIVAQVGEKTVVVRNKNLFTSTSQYDCVVLLHRNGVLVQQQSLQTDVPPQESREYDLPLAAPTQGGEYAVTVSFRLREDALWAPRGHEVAFGQHVYSVDTTIPAAATGPLTIIQGALNIGVRGDGFEVLFSYLDGGLTSYRYGGKEMIAQIPKPNFWRAPTDNDCGNQMPARYAQWKIASMYVSHKHRDGKVVAHPTLTRQEDSATISYRYFLPTTPETECQLAYRVFADGTIETTLSYTPNPALGDMPEFGVLFKLPADYDHIKWYGLGPDESYADRNHGVRLGIYSHTVAEGMAKYLVPQECGNKTGVRWAQVTDNRGRGYAFSGENLNFSALPYTPHELENAKHPHELPQVHYTVVRVSQNQMGIAGDDSWGARTHPEYLIDTTKPMRFTFRFKGI